jgi:drug/metabolite transporter (DMT)-like permease
MTAVRYLDVILVILTLPFVAVAGLPLLGCAVGAFAWICQRLAAVLLERRAREREDLRSAIGINVAGMIGRAWLVGLTILAVGLAGDREDGVAAAALILAAFTVYFSMTLLLRSLERSSARP